MTLGMQDKKKVGFLAVLGLGALYSVYTNVIASPETPASSTNSSPRASTPEAPIPLPGSTPPKQSQSPRARSRSEEFHPVLRSKRPEDRIDPTKIDPTLRLDLLAKVQAVDLAGGSRNLFQFGQPPALQQAKVELPPEPKIIPVVGPRKPPDPPPPAPPPPPPPIPLKFYAYWTGRETGKKTACFIDGEDIVMAGEGETLKRRYRVIRINPTSVVMEDLDVKKQQTLPLVEESQGA